LAVDRRPVVATLARHHLLHAGAQAPGIRRRPTMRVIPAALFLALSAAPALAQGTGSLPPPVPVPGATTTPPPNDAAAARQPGLGERTGAAVDRAAEQTGQVLERAAEDSGSAIGRALRWSGQQMQGAGEWTARQGERMTGPGTPAQPATPPASR
jgi:hypothetical protein